ncbi:glycosyltransferase [Corynebacterium choanae]|uniref:Spore protein YkvP n=1 Tax=Corynebacterium choanae TaxID=1862358 RepID=A0A3G6J556_9CORY|nr:glycosyltransferase [Corynebacterium choanae]AZA13231.1 Spore protein YkvP [Corynebacterium choanae]
MRTKRTRNLARIAANIRMHFHQGGIEELLTWSVPLLAAKLNATLRLPAPRLSWLPGRSSGFDPLRMRKYRPLPHPLTCPELRVGVIMDDFSLSAWATEFQLIELLPANWRKLITTDSPQLDLVFIESSWNGNHGAWRGHCASESGPSNELSALIAAAKKAGIPTLLWNKEDPPHFQDFLPLAQLVDVVFTTDETVINKYLQALSHNRVYCLPFAAQPSVHNPVRMIGVERTGDVAFAGMYFTHKYPERRKQLDYILGGAVEAAPSLPQGLTIYSRFHGKDPRYQFPQPFARFVVGSLPYEQMLTAYRAFKVFLNVNTVTSSPSMCSRRIFELLASGAAVVSSPSAAVREFFPPEEVVLTDTSETTALAIRGLVRSPELRERMVHKAQRRIWSHHTYTHRLTTILDTLIQAAGDNANSRLYTARAQAQMCLKPTVGIISSTNRPGQIHHLLTQVARQQYPHKHLYLATHGFTLSEAELDTACADAGLPREEISCFTTDASWTLGQNLNYLVARNTEQLCAKFDDDDIYGDHYLGDQVNALRYSAADLVGKRAVYMYLGGSNIMLTRFPDREHTFSNFVAGPTFLARTSLFRQFPFAEVNCGEDSALLAALLSAGKRIYAADRFNFIQMRRSPVADPNGIHHTWAATEDEFLTTGIVQLLHFDSQIADC